VKDFNIPIKRFSPRFIQKEKCLPVVSNSVCVAQRKDLYIAEELAAEKRKSF
jgi:hypothetical protein